MALGKLKQEQPLQHWKAYPKHEPPRVQDLIVKAICYIGSRDYGPRETREMQLIARYEPGSPRYKSGFRLHLHGALIEIKEVLEWHPTEPISTEKKAA